MTEHTCLHCHKPIAPEDRVPAPPAGSAHRDCDAKHRAENPDHPAYQDPDIERIVANANREHEYILSETVKIRGGDKDTITWSAGTLVVRRGDEIAVLTDRYSSTVSKVGTPRAFSRVVNAIRPLCDDDERTFTVRRQRMIVRVEEAGLSSDVAAVLLALLDGGFVREHVVDTLLTACRDFDVKPDQQWGTSLMYRAMMSGIGGAT